MQRNKNSRQKILVLSKKQYEHLLYLNAGEEKKVTSKQDEAYREFLKVTSKEMTETWENSIEKSRLKKAEEGKLIKLQAATKDENYVKQIKIMDEAKRNEIIEKAEKLIQKSKIGPRSLESAALLSEVLQEREKQVTFLQEQKRLVKQEELNEARNILNQAKQWVEETAKRHNTDRKRNSDYKLEVRRLAEEKEQERVKKLKADIAHDRYLFNLAKQEDEEDKNKKCEIEEQKKSEFRSNLLEAIDINKDKKRQKRAQSMIRNAISEAYILGKSDIVNNNRIKKDQMIQKAEKIKEIVAEKYDKIQKEIEVKVAADALALFKSKCSVDLEIIDKRETERQEQASRIKEMRLQQQVELEAKQKLDKQKIIDEIQEEYMVLARNNLVTMAYQKQKVANIKSKSDSVRKFLNAQLKEKYEEMRKQRRQDIQLRNMNMAGHLEDDKNFYTYADNLLADARAKGRSTMQLKRAVEAYQNNNLLRYKDKDNRDFLFSKVPIGLTQSDRLALPKVEDTIGKYNLDELKDLKLEQKY